MALESLPDTVLQLVVAKLGVVDTIALSCTCRRLHRPAAGNGGPGQQQQVSLPAAAACQRLQVVANGGWRDELLLTAWQQQQLMAAAEAASKQHGAGASASRPSTSDKGDYKPDLLHCGLGLGFTETARSQPMQQQALVNFSGFLMPGPGVVDATRHFITDGIASVFVGPGTDFSSDGTHPGTAATARAAGFGQKAPGHGEVRMQQPQPLQSDTAQHLPAYERHTLSDRMQLLKGHLPPQVVYSSVGGPYNRRSNNAAQLHNPVADVLASSIDEKQGLQQLSYLCRHKQQGSNQRLQRIVGSLRAGGAAGSDSSSSPASDDPNPLLQCLVLPLPAPAGSIADLNHPWPPALYPGALGPSRARGLDSDPVLRMALIQQEPAAVLRGPSYVYGDFPLDFLPRSFHNTLQHLDLSGATAATSEEQLITAVVKCGELKSLRLAGTAASSHMFGALAHRDMVATLTCCTLTAESKRRSRQHNASAGPGGAAARPASDATQSQMQHSHSAAASLPWKTPALDAVGNSSHQLVVLDVSACAALQRAVGGEPVFAAFRHMLGSLTHLKVLLCCRINVDGALQTAAAASGTSEPTSAAAATATYLPSNSPAPSELKATNAHVTSKAEHLAAEAARLRAVLGSLTELDISYATSLSPECMVDLVTTCTQLKKLGVVGCKTLASEGGTDRLQAALLHMQQQPNTSSPPGSSAGAALVPALNEVDSSMAALSLQRQQHVQYEDRADASRTQHQQLHHQQLQQLLPEQQGTAQLLAAASTIGYRPACHGLPQFIHLSVGWGWSAASIAVLLRHSDCLTSFSAGVGACVTDSVLMTLASSCPHLQGLKLSLCPVSSTGVGAVLASCRKLTSLQLQQCVGPFSMHELLQHKLQQRKSWKLSTLQLDGPPVECRDAELLQLLGISLQQHSTALPTTSPRSAKSWQALTNLCLVRVIGLSDGFLHQLAAAGCQLQHLRLEQCYSSNCSLPACSDQRQQQLEQQECKASGATGSDSSGCTSSTGGPDGTLGTSFSQAALLRLLSQTCSLTIRSLQTRHAVSPLTVDFVELAIAAAPLLQRLVLDACDLLDKGVLVPEAHTAGTHAALQAIHASRTEEAMTFRLNCTQVSEERAPDDGSQVVRCQELSEALAADAKQHTTGPINDHPDFEKHRHQHHDQQGVSPTTQPMVSEQQVQPRNNSSLVPYERTVFGRRRDKQLNVQLLQVGRTIHLPP